MNLKIWECSCGYQTPLPQHDLQGMSQHLKGSPTGEPFVDFVCPHCGYGTRRFLRDIPDHSLSESQFHPLPLYHAALQCAEARCKVRATVHTVAENGSPTSGPKKKVPSWRLVGICCFEGCPAKERPEDSDVKSFWVTNLAE